jgi:hypothetical protein
MSDRRCPRVRPSRLAREREWLAYESLRFTRFVRIGEPNLQTPTRDSGAYPSQKDRAHAPHRTT